MIKVLKITGVVIAVLIAVLLVATFATNTDFEVERSVVINRPSDEVFEYVLYLRNQDKYSVWVARDPNLRQEFRGTDGTVGFVSAWEGNEESGSGEQEIIGLTQGERIDYELRFFEPIESTSYA